MKRRGSAPEVTLFPFLAVLVCTMGSLILLLVTTTRMIRKQALAESQAAEVAQTENQLEAGIIALPEPPAPFALIAEPSELPPREIASRDKPPELPPLPAPSIPAITPEQVAERELEIQQSLAEHAAARNQLQEVWQLRVDELRAQEQMLADQLQSRAGAISKVKSEGDRAQQEFARYQQVLDDATRQQQSLNSRLQELEQAAEQVSGRMRLLEAELEHLEHAPPPRPEFQIVPFDALTGTVRRPILIECTEDSVIFASEQIQITAAQLSGYAPEYNPLLAGTRALMNYWAQHDGPDAPLPYVLLVVRAKGTVGFYVARKMLDELGQSYGYELVEDDKPIHWPAADPGATQACRKAVDRVLADRSQLVQRLPVGRLSDADDSRYAGRDGQFWLPEIEQLRNPGDQVLFGDPAWSRRREDAAPSRGFVGSTPGANVAQPQEQRNSRRLPPMPAGKPAAAAPDREPDQTMQFAEESSEPRPPGAPSTIDPSFLRDLAAAGERARAETGSGDMPQEGKGQLGKDEATESASERPPTLPLEASEARPLKKLPWGETGGKGQVGVILIERDVRVEIWPDRIQIEEEQPLKITPELSVNKLQFLVAEAIERQVRGWGNAPGGFQWKPQVKVVLHPGGNANLARLQELFEHWKLVWDVQHKLQ